METQRFSIHYTGPGAKDMQAHEVANIMISVRDLILEVNRSINKKEDQELLTVNVASMNRGENEYSIHFVVTKYQDTIQGGKTAREVLELIGFLSKKEANEKTPSSECKTICP